MLDLTTMSSICDKTHQKKNHNHFVVNTRTFQIEKRRNLQMYSCLASYIKKQNEKRKQEMEMSEELKRNKREMEMKRRQDKLTLEEINNELAKQEERLGELKNEKHRLFAEFKKVLTEDEHRKSLQRQKEAAYANISFQNALAKQQQQAPPPPPPVSTPRQITTLHPSFFAQPTIVSTNSSTVNPASFSHHRINGRVPTPTTFAIPKSQPSSVKSHHSNAAPIHTSASIPTSNPYLIPSDRHRVSYKRPHEQQPPVPSPVITSSASHLPFMANYKPLNAPPPGGMPPPPPTGFPPALTSQHLLGQSTLEQLQNNSFYQTLINWNGMAAAAAAAAAASNPFINNPK